MRYLIVIEETDTGFSAYVPDLSGCISVGETRMEIENNIQAKTEGLSLLIPSVA